MEGWMGVLLYWTLWRHFYLTSFIPWEFHTCTQHILIISTPLFPTSNLSQMPPPPPPNCIPSSVYKTLRTISVVICVSLSVETWTTHKRTHPWRNYAFSSSHQLPLALNYGWGLVSPTPSLLQFCMVYVLWRLSLLLRVHGWDISIISTRHSFSAVLVH